MATRRSFIIKGAALLALTSELGARPGSPPATPDGYEPPAGSANRLSKVRFDKAERVGENYFERFARWDRHVGDRHDPSVCKGIYELPNGSRRKVVFWESKLAVDTDGALDIPGDTGTHQDNTSLRFKNGAPINALTVPYIALPSPDIAVGNQKKFPIGPWENSRDNFAKDFGIRLGTLGVVIVGQNVTGVIYADNGPAMKIGEGSIRLHELVRGSRHPWSGDIPRRRLNQDDGLSRGALYFLFPDFWLEINQFDSYDQEAMSQAVQRRGSEAFALFLAAQK